MIMNIIFFATMYPIVFIMLFLFSTQNKYENGRLFAVNMKKEWIKDATVADIRQKFKKEMRYYAILLAIVPFVSLLTSHMSIQLTIWMFWLLAAIFLLSLPIMRANHRLKTLPKCCDYRREPAGTLCGIKTGWLRKKSPVSPVFPAKYHQYCKCPVAASKVQRAWDFLSDRCLLRAGLLACSCMDRPPAGFRHQYGQ